MAGAKKIRAHREKHGGSSGPPSTTGRSSHLTRSSDRSTTQSISGKYDGPKDNHLGEPQLTTVADLRNFEMSFGMWDAARGVSLPSSYFNELFPLHSLVCLSSLS
jgi:hypothetical protein